MPPIPGVGHNELVFEDDQDMAASADQARPTVGPQGQPDPEVVLDPPLYRRTG